MVVENMFVGLDLNLLLCCIIDCEYECILKFMFDLFMVIVWENFVVVVFNVLVDFEDKEVFNFYILLIENMNYFLEEVDMKGLDFLEEWKDQVNNEYYEYMGLYVNVVVCCFFGKLFDYLENIEVQF